jgi:RimK family alpha-L-glutamate ligase
MRFAIVLRRATPTSERLAAGRVGGVEWVPMSPEQALATLEAGDVALGRLDVLPTLDGVDAGLWTLGALAERGVHVLNGPAALLASHDKLLTARVLRRAGIPHPHTRLVTPDARPPGCRGSVVVKPRFGSWGRAVERCSGPAELACLLERLQGESWFRAHGALVQELVPPVGHDLRLLVAGNRVVGAVTRVAASGEWRTNVALGAARLPVHPPAEARALAVSAAAAAGADLVGVDLLPTPAGEWVVLELNGAVEFSSLYALDEDVFAATSLALAVTARGSPAAAVPALA